MGLFEAIFFRNNYPPIKNIDLDIYTGSIGNIIRLGDSLTGLETKLGYPKNWWQMYKYKRWLYPHRGLIIEGRRDIIDSFQFILSKEATLYGSDKRARFYFRKNPDLLEPYTSAMIISNKRVSTQELKLSDINELLGTPKEENKDDEEIIWRYENNYYIEFEFNLNEQVQSIYVSLLD
jgi:hypothetical protein